ncbi:hypothetical protein [Arsenicicoccus sp. oral taxon 190]|uniref:hypothetical protein n=1 Tax=Arsenicicoccus sp. oral taxon 190 TaxID=1658671 RepID=UPI00067A3A56|nr:hypothetical protein [Arsenicicoccus sp. oral taxon 190]AKT51374.1 hypothetical protein ADJ73_08650 [Arsenicicoccus sp. oral taxon 190]
MPTTSPRQQRRRTHRLVVAAVVVALVVLGVGYVWRTARDFAEGFGSSTCRAVASSYTATLDPDQMANASTITGIAVRRGLPARAATIALATAMQESKLHNIDYGDRDSVGLFQQRPSQGWGTAEQIMDPVHSTNAFYDALVKVDGWQTMEITKIAQRVQRSGFPEAYADHEGEGRALASTLSGHTPGGLGCRLKPLETRDHREGAVSVARHLEQELRVATVVGNGQVEVSGGDAQQAWLVGHWAVAHAQAYGLSSVTVGNREWTRQRGQDGWQWHPATTPAAANHVVVR